LDCKECSAHDFRVILRHINDLRRTACRRLGRELS
jgi:hypothetical protein